MNSAGESHHYDLWLGLSLSVDNLASGNLQAIFYISLLFIGLGILSPSLSPFFYGYHGHIPQLVSGSFYNFHKLRVSSRTKLVCQPGIKSDDFIYC